MKSISRNLLFSLLVSTFCLLSAPLVAADDPPPLADGWLFTIKNGEMSAFLEGVKKHMEVRKANNDPRAWNLYTARLGDSLNKVAIRYCCVDWADLDAYDEWSRSHPAVLEDWYAGPAKHVEKVEHYLDQIDWPNSHWDEDDGPYRLFAVTEWKLKPGHSNDFEEARKKMSQIAMDQGWATPDRSWIWGSAWGGVERKFIVTPHSNFADIGDNDESFFRFLSKVMGSEEAAAGLMKQFSGSTYGSKVQLWEHQPDYSMSE